MKSIFLSTILAVGLIGGAFVISNKPNAIDSAGENNVSIVDGKQVIEIEARGGYFPRTIEAKGGVPTILRVKTDGTFDCSSALTIPSLGYRNNLPISGTTDIEIPSQEAGTAMRGLCTMGMYSFLVNFN